MTSESFNCLSGDTWQYYLYLRQPSADKRSPFAVAWIQLASKQHQYHNPRQRTQVDPKRSPVNMFSAQMATGTFLQLRKKSIVIGSFLL